MINHHPLSLTVRGFIQSLSYQKYFLPFNMTMAFVSLPSIQPLAQSVTHISNMSYPRTGKRGVPQQFARRLYDMLQSEAKLAPPFPDDGLIEWSESGLAFRILDVKGFTSSVLPKYFRTKKFSSFQRNLNLVSI
jgi:hypothetical protein